MEMKHPYSSAHTVDPITVATMKTLYYHALVREGYENMIILTGICIHTGVLIHKLSLIYTPLTTLCFTALSNYCFLLLSFFSSAVL